MPLLKLLDDNYYVWRSRDAVSGCLAKVFWSELIAVWTFFGELQNGEGKTTVEQMEEKADTFRKISIRLEKLKGKAWISYNLNEFESNYLIPWWDFHGCHLKQECFWRESLKKLSMNCIRSEQKRFFHGHLNKELKILTQG